jgi:hypothetical protein
MAVIKEQSDLYDLYAGRYGATWSTDNNQYETAPGVPWEGPSLQDLTQFQNDPEILKAMSDMQKYGTGQRALGADLLSKGKGLLTDATAMMKGGSQQAIDLGRRMVSDVKTAGQETLQSLQSGLASRGMLGGGIGELWKGIQATQTGEQSADAMLKADEAIKAQGRTDYQLGQQTISQGMQAQQASASATESVYGMRQDERDLAIEQAKIESGDAMDIFTGGELDTTEQTVNKDYWSSLNSAQRNPDSYGGIFKNEGNTDAKGQSINEAFTSGKIWISDSEWITPTQATSTQYYKPGVGGALAPVQDWIDAYVTPTWEDFWS